MNKHFIIMTLLLCGISQQTFPLIVTHFSPETNEAQEACIPMNNKVPILDDRVDNCIHSLKRYVASMENRVRDLFQNYTWLMNHADKLTDEQVVSLKNFKRNLATHEALRIFKMISASLEDENSLTECVKDLMTNSYRTQSIANTLAKGEANLIAFEKTINQYVALVNNDNQQ